MKAVPRHKETRQVFHATLAVSYFTYPPHMLNFHTLLWDPNYFLLRLPLHFLIQPIRHIAALPPTASDSYATATSDQICKSQESMLALIWTVGIFALNCGPVLMGFVLDYLGPKFTAILGVCLNMLGLILFGVSSTSGTNAFIAAAIILGLGNITFHLAQFHISALYPRKRGLVSSVFVAGFTGSGIIMYILLLIFQDAGYTT